MDIAFFINDRHELKPSMTTALLAHAVHRLGHRVALVDVGCLMRTGDGTTAALGVMVGPSDGPSDLQAFLAGVRESREGPIDLTHVDAVWSRTNPARDERRGVHVFAEWVLSDLEDQGVPVLNSCRALRLARDKTYLTRLDPTLRPRTRVATSSEALLEFVSDMPRSVFKPAQGTRGRGVFVLSNGDANARAILELLLADGPVVAQEYIAGAAEGDVRILVAGGAPVELDGRWAAVRRVPTDTDHRSNIHSGGSARPADLTEPQQEVARAVASQLWGDGIWLAGIDLIGHRVCEVNVSAPGGLHDASAFEERDFALAIANQFIECVRQSTRT